ncbi:hypothetical protein Q8G50_34725, partial [Klebsiella pneumoniae]
MIQHAICLDIPYAWLLSSCKYSSLSLELITPLHKIPILSRSIIPSSNYMLQHAFAHQIKLH